jgi:integrase
METLEKEPSRRRKSKNGSPVVRSRKTINAIVKAIRGMFKWGVSMELVSPETHSKLVTVQLLQRGRTTAPETLPRQPVDDAVVDATLPHLQREIADMVRIQRRIGCRPGELCRMRRREVRQIPERDLNGGPPVFEWQPEQHKNLWREHDAKRFIGPQAMKILKPYLRGNPDDYCFSAADSEAARNADRRAARKSPMTPSQRERRKKARRRSKPRTPITEDAYRRAITRACDRHGIPRWTPHQLRHSAGTEARNGIGIEAAQARLGMSVGAHNRPSIGA